MEEWKGGCVHGDNPTTTAISYDVLCIFNLGINFFFSLREFVACSRLVGKTTPGLIFCVVSQHGGWVEERCQRGGADESYTSPVMRDDAKRTSLITDLSN